MRIKQVAQHGKGRAQRVTICHLVSGTSDEHLQTADRGRRAQSTQSAECTERRAESKET